MKNVTLDRTPFLQLDAVSTDRATRILKIGDQRQPHEMGRLRPKI
jgi:hypothetical protein